MPAPVTTTRDVRHADAITAEVVAIRFVCTTSVLMLASPLSLSLSLFHSFACARPLFASTTIASLPPANTATTSSSSSATRIRFQRGLVKKVGCFLPKPRLRRTERSKTIHQLMIDHCGRSHSNDSPLLLFPPRLLFFSFSRALGCQGRRRRFACEFAYLSGRNWPQCRRCLRYFATAAMPIVARRSRAKSLYLLIFYCCFCWMERQQLPPPPLNPSLPLPPPASLTGAHQL